jgi:hypothetical protein
MEQTFSTFSGGAVLEVATQPERARKRAVNITKLRMVRF